MNIRGDVFNLMKKKFMILKVDNSYVHSYVFIVNLKVNIVSFPQHIMRTKLRPSFTDSGRFLWLIPNEYFALNSVEFSMKNKFEMMFTNMVANPRKFLWPDTWSI